jgi:hypothetical protein
MSNETLTARFSRPWLRWAGVLLGAALLAAALLVLWSRREGVAEALGAVRRPSPAHLSLLAACVLANIALSGAMFSALISRYGRVGALEMQAVTASAALLNYLPLRPGAVGRIAYHAAVNRISARDALMASIQATALTLVIAAYLALALFTAARFGAGLWLWIALPLPLFAAGALAPATRIWAIACACRYADVLVWGVRYYAAFALLGLPLGAGAAMVLACVSVIATMVPLLSNGLGLREWGIGLASPLVGAATLETGLAADLLNRAVEIVVVALAGSLAMLYLARRRRTRS